MPTPTLGWGESNGPGLRQSDERNHSRYQRLPITTQFVAFHIESMLLSRVVVPELMDDAELPRRAHEQALAGLSRLNSWSRSYSGLWAALRNEAQLVTPRPLRVLDVATGSGDIPIQLALRARRTGVNLSLAACDISATALESAQRRATKNNVVLETFSCDATNEPLPLGYDVVMTSLFLHHLSEPTALGLLQSMAAAASRVVLVNDLERSRLNLCLVTLASRLLSRSAVVHFDAPTSVRAAFTIPEVQALAARAGLANAVVMPHVPCRWLLSWRKPT